MGFSLSIGVPGFGISIGSGGRNRGGYCAPPPVFSGGYGNPWGGVNNVFDNRWNSVIGDSGNGGTQNEFLNGNNQTTYLNGTNRNYNVIGGPGYQQAVVPRGTMLGFDPFTGTTRGYNPFTNSSYNFQGIERIIQQ
ncbi:MAG: hypothetical protein K2X01_02510 [Cyanobacteria bacterium]|nr:hypothetical protein [Cyanobacteriota bacterium]